ncbi:putative toxin [Mycobacteroides salmoniphilum]|uniref:putative toxin n=1 Tax=Mycobacteroides salmoniphilum TaxID=404941 RepID=UPI0009933F2C|nr:putative toxin [Mycobacteroides salmoniphilum]
MTKADPEWFYSVAAKLAEAATSFETRFTSLDQKLDVSRSAGSYATGGPRWSSSYDQSASDVFEVGSLGVMAATVLANLVHEAGLNEAKAENESSPNGPQERTPSPPQGSKINHAMHPSQLSVGGDHSKPDHWSLIADYVKKEWADCDEGRIRAAGSAFSSFGTDSQKQATDLWYACTAIFTDERQKGYPEIGEMVTEIANVCGALKGEVASDLGVACEAVGSKAAEMKKLGQQSLTILHYIILSYEVDKVLARRLPWGDRIRKGIDRLIEFNKREYAKANDNLMESINQKVDQAAQSNEGINNLATTDAKFLSNLLDRIPRQTDPIRNRTKEDNEAAGDEGERRAGINPRGPKRTVRVTVDTGSGPEEVAVVPDRIDDTNRQVTEVKNTNEIRPDRAQILAEAEWARQNGYTMTLVVDHRTVINDPKIQEMVSNGQIQVIRKELDDAYF